MVYFDGIKIGDRVWSFEYGWGTVKELIYNSPYPIGVVFDNEQYETFTLDGKIEKSCNQTLFWDEIKFEIPKKHKIKLKENEYFIDLEISEVVNGCKYAGYGSGLRRDDKETAEKALKQIKNFMRLLALRDQECPNSRGYEFKLGERNYCLFKKEETGEYDYDNSYNCNYLGVYFKTEEDAQKICDILNYGRFDLEGE